MVTWQQSNPCPSCGRTGTSGIKCNNCQTVGCSNGNCTHGGPNSFLQNLQKEHFKSKDLAYFLRFKFTTR